MKFFCYFVIILALNGIVNLNGQVNLPNLLNIYNITNDFIHPSFRFYHKDDTISYLIFRLNFQEINLVKQSNRSYEARFGIKLFFYGSLDKMNLLDTVYKEITINTKSATETYTGMFEFKTFLDSAKTVIILKDLYSKQRGIAFIEFNRSPNSPQNIILMDSTSSKIPVNNFVKPNHTYFLNCRYKDENFVVKKYKINNSLPSSVSYSEDIQEELVLKEEFATKEGCFLKLKDTAIYEFVSVRNPKLKTYFVNFGESFPYFLYPVDLLKVLVYLTTSSEFAELTSKTNAKLALDDFWLLRAKNPQKAKNLIKIYYNRAFYANQYFTTTIEGWRTDRGMILIVFGMPSYIKKTDNQEQWQYHNSATGKTLLLTFTKQKRNSLTDDFFLTRSSELFVHWQAAVKAWNNGEVYVF